VLLQRADLYDEGDPYQVHPPSDEPAWQALPLIRFSFEQNLRSAFNQPAPDSPEGVVVYRAIEILRALVLEFTGRRIPAESELMSTEGGAA
jgi:hypothetical protein